MGSGWLFPAGLGERSIRAAMLANFTCGVHNFWRCVPCGSHREALDMGKGRRVGCVHM